MLTFNLPVILLWLVSVPVQIPCKSPSPKRQTGEAWQTCPHAQERPLLRTIEREIRAESKANRQPHQLFPVPRAQHGRSSALKSLAVPLCLKTCGMRRRYGNGLGEWEKRSSIGSDLLTHASVGVCVLFSCAPVLADTVV